MHGAVIDHLSFPREAARADRESVPLPCLRAASKEPAADCAPLVKGPPDKTRRQAPRRPARRHRGRRPLPPFLGPGPPANRKVGPKTRPGMGVGKRHRFRDHGLRLECLQTDSFSTKLYARSHFCPPKVRQAWVQFWVRNPNPKPGPKTGPLWPPSWSHCSSIWRPLGAITWAPQCHKTAQPALPLRDNLE